jgi:hypothetical protein
MILSFLQDIIAGKADESVEIYNVCFRVIWLLPPLETEPARPMLAPLKYPVG